MSKRPPVAPCIVGQRLKSARDIACLSTDEAARRLGIKSPSRLTSAEHPSHPKGITPQLLADAARTYGVSADYLLGRADDWENRAELPPLADILGDLADLQQRRKSLVSRIDQFLDGEAPTQAACQALAREAVALVDELLAVGGRQATAHAPGGT
ncbi:XRE family transcriptional regulator [Zoogloea oleivorans]|uniref:XRE family transcriptional regulator n=1 Tax=Zoogloea oleivorans TaxID=1552750 RepID=A0A6C2D4S8_9RHOO|nr:helix-turn-helix transcriptional regulator [Zoogloea oleivorans]TYC61327.1 XRE family transcriptional regulator [Zoogloea oleivorans]